MQTTAQILEKLITERGELVTKVFNLEKFMMSPDFQRTDKAQQTLLCEQYKAMKDYSTILLKRIMCCRGKEMEDKANGTQSN